MNAYTIAVRTQEANARILAAAKQLAARFTMDDQLVALEAVKDKDPQAELVKRLEAIAALLEQIANAPANTPAPAISSEMPAPTPRIDNALPKPSGVKSKK